jgi:predicted alpha/beta-hydrolase family hydrolase
MVTMAEAMAARGVTTATFNFLYAERKRRAPDKNDVLEATWRAALDAVRTRMRAKRVFIGGKSMGGRIATQIAAQPGDLVSHVAGVVLLGYPLHPPGKPDQLRTKHLANVRAPMLFIQGTRDPFGSPDELAPHIAGIAGARILPIEGGDHSLALPKRKGAPTLAATLAMVADEIERFIGSR